MQEQKVIRTGRLEEVFYTEDQSIKKTTKFYKNGQKCRETWYKNMQKHRDDGPAETYWREDGSPSEVSYYQNGQYHNDNGPAIIEYGQTAIEYHIWLRNGAANITGPGSIWYWPNGQPRRETWADRQPFYVEYAEDGAILCQKKST